MLCWTDCIDKFLYKTQNPQTLSRSATQNVTMAESEYLVLPANSSPKTYPDNRNNAYKVKIPKRLQLQSNKWVIALRSMHYSENWKNVKRGIITVTHKQRNGRVAAYDCPVRCGRYLEPWVLLVEMRVAINSNAATREKIIFHHDETMEGLMIGFNDEDWSVKFSEELANIWGMNAKQWYSSTSASDKTYRCNSAPDPFAGYAFMYVYCSLVEPRVVGHSLVPLLMEVPVQTPDKKVKRINVIPSQPQYVPVVNTDTDEVEIDIRRGDGQPFLFDNGVVSVTVELRKRH